MILARNVQYIRRVYASGLRYVLAGRGRLFLQVGSHLHGCWARACLVLPKIMENMESGHNVMHGQYDWMNDPGFNGRKL